MEIGKFRKKPVVIEAIPFNDGRYGDELFDWLTADCNYDDSDGVICQLEIETLEGNHTVSDGDWIIKGVKGEFYPCKPDIFVMTYEPDTSHQGRLP